MNGCQFFSRQYFNDCLHVGAVLETESDGNCRSRLKRWLMSMRLAVSGKMVSLWHWVSALARSTWKSSEAGVLRLSRQSNRQPPLLPMLSSLKQLCSAASTLWTSAHSLASYFSMISHCVFQCRNFDQCSAAHHLISVLVQRACPVSTGES